MKIKLSVKTISRILIICTIILMIAFQYYWINSLYNDQWQNLKKEADVTFRDVVYRLQLQRFRSDTTFFKREIPDNLFVFDVLDSMKEKLIDSPRQDNWKLKKRQVMISVTNRHPGDMNDTDIIRPTDDSNTASLSEDRTLSHLKYFSFNKPLNDSLSLAQLDSAYKSELIKNGIKLLFTIKTFSGKENELHNTIKPGELKTNFTFVGLSQVHAYQAEFANPFRYVLSKIKFQLLFSFILVTVTLLSLIFLYRNLINQRRLAIIKNEFISNITHELKTPIATMNVAIEALRNFNAIDSPQRTKEYLDISASELQRLSLLVDNVLRLSIFEHKEVELKKEKFDFYDLTQETLATMQLQFDKVNAKVALEREGNRFIIYADKIYITSMIYNLLDNALKYSKENPQIRVKIISHMNYIELRVIDNAIGIAPEYLQKVLEKFFRVPNDGHHDTKGYGLGLSYVNHIAARHHGFIEIQSEMGKGSTFSVKLPYEETDDIRYGRGRVTRKMKL